MPVALAASRHGVDAIMEINVMLTLQNCQYCRAVWLAGFCAASRTPIGLALGAPAGKSCRTRDGVAGHATGEFMLDRAAVHLGAETEADLVAAQPGILQLDAAAANAHRTLERLIFLFQYKLVELRLSAPPEPALPPPP